MLDSELGIRVGFFLCVLGAVLLWEALSPKRPLHIVRKMRWWRNLSLVAMGSALVRVALPFTTLSVAIYAEGQQMGLLHALPLPFAASVILSVLLLDLLIYAQHVLFHHVPVLWRLHKVHHIDQEIDVTTGVRFHPVEILLSTLIKCGAVLLLGIPLLAVLIFEILLNATAMFNHGNIHLPGIVDRWLRLMLVTPDMHRVHHSVIAKETNSNFGFNLPWWDRLFGTYRAQPARGHLEMDIGLKGYPDIDKTGVLVLLLIPFRNRVWE